MNKKIFLGMFATAALFATSCSQEEMVAPGENGTTTFTVNVEGNTASRAIGDASNVNQLVYEVYNAAGDLIVAEGLDGVVDGKFPMNLELDLIKNQKYTLLLWAQNSGSGYDTKSLENVTVVYGNNNENKDAFYGRVDFVAGNAQTVVLKRAMAQINVGATAQDIARAKDLGVEIATSAVTVTKVPTVFNIMDGSVSGEQQIVLGATEIAGAKEELTVNGQKYVYLASTYVLAGDKALVELDYAFNPATGEPVLMSVPNVPVQQNYRTNIVGTILSNKTNISISLDNVWENNNLYTPWDGVTTTAVEEVDGVYEIENGEQLAWVAQQVNTNADTFYGKTVKLVDDIYLANLPWTAIGNVNSYPSCTFAGTFDGQDYTIYDLNVTAQGDNGNAAAGLFGSITGKVQNLKVVNATVVSSHYAGVICAYSSTNGMEISNCHVNNATVTSKPEILADGSYDNGDKAGAIIGYMVAADVVKDCSVANTSITAYRDLAGIVGYSAGTVENCKVLDDVTVTVDATNNYKGYTKPAEFDANTFVGENHGTITGCIGEAKLEVPETVVTIGNAADLREMLNKLTDSGSGNNTINITSDIIFEEGETWTPVEVEGYTGAGVITINGNGFSIKGIDAPLFAGGFAGASGIVINDLTITSSEIVSTNTLGSGAFVETIDSMEKITLNNCHLEGCSLSGSRTGGFIGWNSGYNNTNDGAVKTYVTIKGCSVKNCQITGNGTVGGIVGHAGANAWTFNTIENCVVEGCTLTSYDDSYRVGVIVGTANIGEVTISNCVSKNNICKQDNNGVEIARPKDQSELYGRFVPGTTGKLIIDGVEIK